MKNRKYSSSRMLVLGYVIVFIFFLYFTLTSFQDLDLKGIVINILMLIVVAIIFIYAGKRIKDIKNMEINLDAAIAKIEIDFETEQVMLWE